jgi:rare lipoprotein A
MKMPPPSVPDRGVWRRLLLLLAALLLFADTGVCSQVRPRTQLPYVINDREYYPIPSAKGFREEGIASWYGPTFHGRSTSNGEVYNMHAMTAAHKTLPMDTMLLVKNIENGRSTVVRVNDRGPFIRGRVIDLSYQAAKTLAIVRDGTARVQLVALAEGHRGRQGGPPVLDYRDLSAGEFYVQIGAFADKANATRLQKRFTDAGHTTVIQQYLGSGTPLYRVQVYAGKSLSRARTAEKALLDRGYQGAFIIAR